jgi:hypothetical protein
MYPRVWPRERNLVKRRAAAARRGKQPERIRGPMSNIETKHSTSKERDLVHELHSRLTSPAAMRWWALVVARLQMRDEA